jgi:hypothetical protein
MSTEKVHLRLVSNPTISVISVLLICIFNLNETDSDHIFKKTVPALSTTSLSGSCNRHIMFLSLLSSQKNLEQV